MSILVTRRTQDVPLFQGNDLAAITEAERAVAEVDNTAAGSAGMRVGDLSPFADACALRDALVAEALPRAVVVVVRALRGKSYRKLLAECPPREGNEGDAAVGFDQDSMGERLVDFMSLDHDDDRTIIEPAFTTQASLTDWVEQLGNSAFARIFAAAFAVNEEVGPDPKVSFTSRLGLPSSTSSE